MKCYYHPQIDAVAVCKHCQKGLCLECAIDVGGGIACKDNTNDCQAEVKFILHTYAVSKRQYQISRRTYTQLGIFIGIPGIIFTLYGLSGAGGDMRLVAAALLSTGFTFLLIGIYFFISGRNLREK